jgi:DNA gyrase subunit A
VRGIALREDDYVVAMVVPSRENTRLLVVTEGGMGKRTEFDAYRLQGRGGKGVINIKTTAKTGKVVGVKSVSDRDELVLITRKGVVNRQSTNQIRVIGRATQGVRLINLDSGDSVVDVARIIPEDPEEEAGDEFGVEGAAADAERVEEEAGVVESGSEDAQGESDEHSDDEG